MQRVAFGSLRPHSHRSGPRRARALLGSWVALVAILAGLLTPLLPAAPTADAASAVSIKWPFMAGTTWRITQGYNNSPTAGWSHWNCDPLTLKDTPSSTRTCSKYWQYKYSFDFHIEGGTTAGQPIIAPANGTLRWIDEAHGGGAIDLGNGYAIAFFHIDLLPSITEGMRLQQGQLLGFVSPPGGGGNGGSPHLHFNIWQTADGGMASRIPVPFSGPAAVDGYDFPALSDDKINQHHWKKVTSTNQMVGVASTAPTTPGLVAPIHGSTFWANTYVATFQWNAVQGATEYQLVINDGGITTPWQAGTSWVSGALTPGQYAWQVRARNASGQSALSPKWVFWVERTSGPSATPNATPGALGMALSKTSGAPDLSLTASGAGMTSGETVSVYLDNAAGPKLGTAVVNAAGNWSTTIQIPDAPGGQHAIVAIGGTSNATTHATFTITPTMTRSPYQGPPGTQVGVTLRGFGASEVVTLRWDGLAGAQLGSVTTDATGRATLTIALPDGGPGWHDYVGRGATSGLQAWGALSIQPSVSVTATQGAPGASITLTARGFATSRSIRVGWNQSASAQGTTLCSGTSSSTGTYTCTFSIPQSSSGAFPVVVKTSDGTTQSVVIGVEGPAAMTISPTSGVVGGDMQLSLGGFTAGEQVQLTWDASTTVWRTITVSAAGAALDKATIPYLSSGAHTLVAKGKTSGKQVTGTVTVSPGMSLSAAGGAVGATTTAYVRGMPASATITVRFDSPSAGSGTSVCSGTTNASGSYSCTITVPSTTTGRTVTIRATSGSTHATTSFAVLANGVVAGGSVLGLGTYQITGTQEGLVGGTTSSGHKITPHDHFVSLPACTKTSCPSLTPGVVHPVHGLVVDCKDKCFVRVTNPATGMCRVEPILDVGPWFTNDNWWDPAERRSLNNLPSTINILPQGYTAADAAKDGYDVGYGLSNRGWGVSNKQYEVGNRASIDIADGTWIDIGLADGAGPRTVVVTMLWQTGEDVATATAACLPPTPTPTSTRTATGSPTATVTGTPPTATPTATTPACATIAVGCRVVVPAGVATLNVRAAASTTGTLLGTVATGAAGTVLDGPTVANGYTWWRVQFATITGWSAGSFMQVVGATATPTALALTATPTLTPTPPATATPAATATPTSTATLIATSTTTATSTRTATPTRTSTATRTATATVAATATACTGIAIGCTVRVPTSATTLNVRSTPSTTGTRVGTVTAGATGLVLDGPRAANGYTWWRVQFPGVTGWVAGSFLTTMTTTPTRTATPAATATRTATRTGTPTRTPTAAALTASLSTDVLAARVGTNLTISGEGFVAGETIRLGWKTSGAELGVVVADSNGAFVTSVKVPVAIGGAHTISASGLTSGRVGEQSITVAQSLVIDPTSGQAGTTVTYIARGFQPGEALALRWETTSGAILVAVITGDLGTYSGTITIPDAAVVGARRIVAVGSVTRAATIADIVVLPARDAAVTTGAARVAVGASLALAIDGFWPGEAIAIYWDDRDTPVGGVDADDDGMAATTVVGPTVPGGAHLVRVVGQESGLVATASVAVDPAAVLREATVPPGGKAVLDVRGWTPGQTVTVRYGATTISGGSLACTATARDTGTASCSFTVPSTARRGATVSIAAGDRSRVVTTTLTIGSPATTASVDSPAIATPTPAQAATNAVSDQATAVPAPVDAPTPTAAPAPETLVFTAVADVTVAEARPDATEDPAALAILTAGGPDLARAYLTFDVQGIAPGTVVSARLWLTNAGDATVIDGLLVLPGHRVDEATASWATVPTADLPPALDATGAPIRAPWLDAGASIALDITGIVTGDGLVTFVITGSPDMLLTIASRETGSTGPALEIVVQR
jgi:hypothetical protein